MPEKTAPRMSFAFDEKRATQAAVYLLNCKGAAVNHYWLDCLLYLADRRTLFETGVPITRAVLECTLDGMRLQEVRRLLDEGLQGTEVSSYWHQHIQVEDRIVSVRQDPGLGELSEYDTDVLTSLLSEEGTRPWRQLVAESACLPEYRLPTEGAYAQQVPYEDMLRAMGCSAELLGAYVDEIAAYNAFIRLLDEAAPSPRQPG